MAYEFDIANTPATTLATASAVVRMEEIPLRITGLFDVVYGWLRESGPEHGGHNHALYRPHPDGLLLLVGVPVTAPFDDTEAVRCVELPALRAAHTRHHGEYSGLPAANAALRNWCSERSLALGPLCWEVYGDWHDEPSRLVTDVYFELEDAAFAAAPSSGERRACATAPGRPPCR